MQLSEKHVIFVSEQPLEARETKMKKTDEMLRQIESDLGLNEPYFKGRNLPVKNCRHFYTDGNAIDRMFEDVEDFKAGMNRVFLLHRKYNISILAFIPLQPWLTGLFHPEPEAVPLIGRLLMIAMMPMLFFWPMSTVMPYTLRSAGDATYSSVVS